MKVIALGNARLGSTRVKNKMIKPFGKTTLVEIALKRINQLKNFDEIYFAVYEDELIDIAKKIINPNSIIRRSKESADADYPITKVLDYLKNIEFDYCMWINSCHALLKAETIDKAINFFKENSFKSMTSVKKRTSWFYDEEMKPLNNTNPTQLRTEKSPPVYEVAHAFHVFNKKYLFQTNSYWSNIKNDPYLYVVSDLEALDVDNEADFIISEAVYKQFPNYC